MEITEDNFPIIVQEHATTAQLEAMDQVLTDLGLEGVAEDEQLAVNADMIGDPPEFLVALHLDASCWLFWPDGRIYEDRQWHENQ